MASFEYTHQTPDWLSEAYRWDHCAFSAELAEVHFRRGEIATAMTSLGFHARQYTVLSVLVRDVTHSSEIEGVVLNVGQVRSSISRRLGIDYAGLPEPDRNVEGVVEMMLDATQRYDSPLTAERIFGWHASLFPGGFSGLYRIKVGGWRDDAHGPMQVVSGPIGRETVHYEAPSAERVPLEMSRFLRWFEEERIDPVLKAAIAHLWFVTVHPLDDGNGRVGRAIMDMALARADGTGHRFYSMSEQIHRKKNAYYDVLERTQRSLSMDATEWIQWFLERAKDALDSAEGVLRIVRTKNAFWEKFAESGLNERQMKVVNLLLDGSFVGNLQTAKYAKVTKASEATAYRDLDDLVKKGVLRTEGVMKGTRYFLADI